MKPSQRNGFHSTSQARLYAKPWMVRLVAPWVDRFTSHSQQFGFG